MSGLQIFKNNNFGELKTIIFNDEIWFVGKEIAIILGYGNGNLKSKAIANAIVDHVDEEDKKMLNHSQCVELFREYQNGDPTFKINSNGMMVINESGLYSLILSSKLPSAKTFKRWVTSEVLPSIRKTGKYDVADKNYNVPKTYIEALEFLIVAEKEKLEFANKNITLKLENKELSKAVEVNKDKVEFYDTVLGSESSFTTRQIAQELGMTATALNKKLAEFKVQYKQSGQWLLYRKYISLGLTKIRTHTPSQDKSKTFHLTVWTEKGREFINKIIKESM